MKWPLHRKIGIGITLLGLAPLVYAMSLSHSHNWKPLEREIKLVPGRVQSPEFETDLNGRYVISLVFDALPSQLQKERCEIGIPSSQDECEGISRTLHFAWQVVSSEGENIRSGSYVPSSFSGFETNFAQFQAKRRGRQSVILTIQRDGGDLNAARPRLVVEAGPEYWETIPDLYGFSLFWAKTVGLFGLLWLVAPICLQVLRNKR